MGKVVSLKEQPNKLDKFMSLLYDKVGTKVRVIYVSRELYDELSETLVTIGRFKHNTERPVEIMMTIIGIKVCVDRSLTGNNIMFKEHSNLDDFGLWNKLNGGIK